MYFGLFLIFSVAVFGQEFRQQVAERLRADQPSLAQALEGKEFALQRHQDRICSRKRVDGQQVQGRWAVDQNIAVAALGIVLPAELRDGIGEPVGLAVNVGQFKLGAEQIAWILAKIDEVPTKQVILVGHHNPQVGGDTSHYKGGLADTADFWPEIAKRTQVKAYIHGHTHEWTQASESRIHIISTIACAYVFNPNTNAVGWTSARFNAHGFELKLHTLEASHAWSGETKWFFGRQPAPKKPAPKKK